MALDQSADELQRAREQIAAQQATIEALQAEREASNLGLRLRAAVLAAAAAPSAERERSGLLDQILQTAADLTRAESSSLLVVNEAGRQLDFVAATGPKAVDVRRLAVPIGHGIVGFVAETGQPMALADITEDPRFYREIGEQLQSIPRSVLCVPVRQGDAIVGVLELLDKAGGGAFTAQDLELADRFAVQAALALEQDRLGSDLAGLLLAGLRSLAGEDAAHAVEPAARDVIQHLRSTPAYEETQALARTIAAIASAGDAERTLVHSWLESFQRYLRERESYF